MTKADIQETIGVLKIYRSGWANDIREGWGCAMEGAREIHFALYEISGSIIFGMQQLLNHDHCEDKMAMVLVSKKLEDLVESDNFQDFFELGKAHITNVVTLATMDHILVMRECLMLLTK